MRMARVNVYLPDALAQEVKDASLNVSAITQAALATALEAGRTDRWLDEVAVLRPTTITHAEVAAAVGAAREEFGE